MDLYSACSQKQQSTGSHFAPFGDIILIPSQKVFALSGEAASTNFIVFGLT
jgi:hypothetical protein